MSTKLHTLISGVGYGNESGPMHQRIYDEIVKEIGAAAWDACLASMVYEDGSPVEIVTSINPYRKEAPSD